MNSLSVQPLGGRTPSPGLHAQDFEHVHEHEHEHEHEDEHEDEHEREE
jgi:ABC-type Zn2+ transport system substrate-binding protein/surface adhesin